MSSKKRTERDKALSTAAESQRGRVLGIIRSLLRDEAEAEDVYQDVLAEFVESYDLSGALENVGTWFVRVAKNKVIDRFRRRKTRDDHRDSVLNGVEIEDLFDADDPESAREREWLRQEILEALESLPAEQRDVFFQHEIEGKSFETISQETGIGINTLLSRKRYALIHLRQHLQEIYDEFGE